ncbi:ABC transporter permease [Pyrococcus sp. ST04]|uniref:ABC transporter permease n=1 Tax=Pyrococcus sp. ST04 TaxID=1183377 RepID=UPI0002605FB7|nr:ABC transporter permease [Pyrococcus sp. ST04]AFK23343.1 ABC transporter ATP-binding protein permease [Pyrococcus sp. ST04]
MFFRYPLRVVSSILVGLVFLLQFIYFGQAILGGRFSALLESSAGIGDYPTYVLIGYTLWWVSVSPMEASVWGVRRELQRGTFESNVVSPTGILKMIVGLAIAWMLMDSIIMAIVFLFGVLLFRIPISLASVFKTLPILAISFLIFLGFGLMFAGLVMMLKNIGPMANILEFVILFLSGVFFPLSALPKVVREVSWLIPLTHAANAVRKVFMGFGYSMVWSELFAMIILLPIYWGISLAIFKWAEKITRMMGYGGY